MRGIIFLMILFLEGGPVFSESIYEVKSDKGTLKINGRLQVQGALYTGADNLLNNGDPAELEGFRIKRSRIEINGSLYKKVLFNLTMELFDKEETPNNLLDAYITYKGAPFFNFKVGAQKFPFSRGYLFSSGNLTFIDRTFATRALAPGRELGLTIFGGFLSKKIKYDVGFFNGLLRKSNFYQGFDSLGIRLGNRFTKFSFVGRIDFEPLGCMGKYVADMSKKGFRIGFGGGAFYSMDPEIFGYSGYLHLKVKGISLFAEYIYEKTKPSKKPSTNGQYSFEIEQTGLNAILSYTLISKFIVIGAKFELIDQNKNIDDEGDEAIYGGVLTIFPFKGKDELKFQLEYTHREELYGKKADNDTVLTQIQLKF